MTDELEHAPTDGLVEIGEITTRVQREAITEPDFRNREATARVKAFRDVEAFCDHVVASAGPYDDLRAVRTLLVWLSDRVREVQTPSYDGDPS